jgi:hypothetical protein
MLQRNFFFLRAILVLIVNAITFFYLFQEDLKLLNVFRFFLFQDQVFSVKFVCTMSGEFDLSASTPIPQVSTLEFKHSHTDNAADFNNEYSLKWNDNAINLKYNRLR